MKKKILVTLLTVTLALSLVACGGSGVSKEEYDKVVSERDELQAQLDALNEKSESGNNASNIQDKEKIGEYKIGDTWEVDGLFKVTVNSVVQSDYRNQFDDSTPGAVYIVAYTYENIGIESELYVNLEDKIVDNAGKMGTSYPGDYDMYPQAVPKGAHCEAQACIAVENPGSFKDYVSIYDDDYNEYTAIFNLDI